MRYYRVICVTGLVALLMMVVVEATGVGRVAYYASNDAVEDSVFNRGEAMRVVTMLPPDTVGLSNVTRSYAFCAESCAGREQHTASVVFVRNESAWVFEEVVIVPRDAPFGEVRYTVWSLEPFSVLAEGNASVSSTFSVTKTDESQYHANKSVVNDNASLQERQSFVPLIGVKAVLAVIVLCIVVFVFRNAGDDED